MCLCGNVYLYVCGEACVHTCFLYLIDRWCCGKKKKIYKLIFFWLQGKQTGFICSVLILLPLEMCTHLHTRAHTPNITLMVWQSVCLSVFLSFMPTHSLPASSTKTSVYDIRTFLISVDLHSAAFLYFYIISVIASYTWMMLCEWMCLSEWLWRPLMAEWLCD